jgi:pimeloyl-ACP methyl ester carboxylesterase
MEAATVDKIRVTTRGGLEIDVEQRGSGPDLVWFHGLVGLAPTEPALDLLARTFTVHAPIWPGFGSIENEERIEDMLDFALLGWDIVDALALDTPIVVGHSFGAMIAAEMACLANRDLDELVLIAPYGLWRDDLPLPDPFAQLPFELTELFFADPEANATKLVDSGVDLGSDEGLAEFMVRNSRRLGTAGKIMFPIPNRRLSKRLYRLEVPTSIIMAGSDHLVVEGYGAAWAQAVPHAEVVTIEGAGHLINLEAPEVLATAITDLLHR